MSDASGASTEVELVQLLTPEGVRVDHPQYSFGGDDDQIRAWYRDMVITRRIDSEATVLQRQGELGLGLVSWSGGGSGPGRAGRLRNKTSSFLPASTGWRGAAASTPSICSPSTGASILVAGTR